MPRMLVVDDEPSILFALGDYFRRLGFTVECAREADEAKRLLAGEAYAVAIADLRLGGPDDREGVRLVQRIRRSSPATRVVVLTAFGTAEVEEEVRKSGADLFLSKPQPLSRIAREVEALLLGDVRF